MVINLINLILPGDQVSWILIFFWILGYLEIIYTYTWIHGYLDKWISVFFGYMDIWILWDIKFFMYPDTCTHGYLDIMDNWILGYFKFLVYG